MVSRPEILDNSVIRSSVKPSAKYPSWASSPTFSNGSTAIDRLVRDRRGRGLGLRLSGMPPWLQPCCHAARGSDQGEGNRSERRPAPSRHAGPLRAKLPDELTGVGKQTIDRHRLHLHPVLAERLEAECDFALDLAIDVAGDADTAGLGQALEACGDVDAIAINVAVLDDDVADVDPDSERDPPVFGKVRLALGDAVLEGRGAFDCVHHAREFDERTVAHQFDDAAVVLGGLGLEEILAQRLQVRAYPPSAAMRRE